MHVGVPELHAEHGQITWSVPVGGLRNAPERLWFSLPEEHAGLVTELADPAVIGLLIPAMHAGETMEIQGRVTDELAHSLTHGYEHILEAVIPSLKRVPLEIANLVPASDPAPGVGTGFSGGIDSFTVLAEHFYQPVADDLRLTHLTLFNVGAMTGGEPGRRHFRRVYSLLAPAADRVGLPLIPVDSNLDDFYPFTNFQQTHGPRNVSTASLLQAGLGRFYFASGHPFSHVSIRSAPDTVFSDPVSIPLLTTRQFRTIFHGSQYTRVEKTLIVTEIEESYENLNVCTTLTTDGRNCSQCRKCLRTELTLDLTGHIDKYDRAFDLDTYRRVRRAYLDEVSWSRDEHVVEIRELARRTGFRLPSAGAGFVRHSLYRALRKARTIRRRYRRPSTTASSISST